MLYGSSTDKPASMSSSTAQPSPPRSSRKAEASLQPLSWLSVPRSEPPTHQRQGHRMPESNHSIT